MAFCTYAPSPAQDMPVPTQDRFHYCSIYDKASAIRDVRAPIAFIFGGESGEPMPELFTTCDVGGFIPSCSSSAGSSALARHGGHEADHKNANQHEAEECENRCLQRMHSCNLSIAACIVLSERHRLRIAQQHEHARSFLRCTELVDGPLTFAQKGSIWQSYLAQYFQGICACATWLNICGIKISK